VKGTIFAYMKGTFLVVRREPAR